MIKRKKKIIVTICLILIIFIVGSFLFYKYGGYLLIEKSEREELFNNINTSSPLPERFYTVYNVVNPGSLNNTLTECLFNQALMIGNKSQYKECIYKDVVIMGYVSFSKISLRRILLASLLDDNFSHRQCLDYYTNRFHFTKEIKGVQAASRYYFNKHIDYLNDEEYIEIVLMMKNSSLYNKKRRPEMMENIIKQILTQLN